MDTNIDIDRRINNQLDRLEVSSLTGEDLDVIERKLEILKGLR